MHTQTGYDHRAPQAIPNGLVLPPGHGSLSSDAYNGEIRRQWLAMLRDDEALIEAFLDQTMPSGNEKRNRMLASALSSLAQWQHRQIGPNGIPCYPGGLRVMVEGSAETIRRIMADYQSSPGAKAGQVREAVSALRQAFPVGAKAVQRWRDETLIAIYRRLEPDTDDLDLLTTQLRHLADEVPRGLVGLLRQSPEAREQALDDFIGSIPATARRCRATSQLRLAVSHLRRNLDQGRLRLPMQPPPLPPRRHMI